MRPKSYVLGSALVGGLLLGWNPIALLAQVGTFTATATVKSASGQLTAPVTIVITRLTTDAERAKVTDALKKGGTAPVVQVLTGGPDVGYIEIGARKTALKYAYVRPTSGGRLVTVVAPTPIVHLGAGLPDAKPKAGFDLAIVVLDVKDAGAGSGELAPAATIKVTEAGAIQTQDYGADVVMLTNVRVQEVSRERSDISRPPSVSGGRTHAQGSVIGLQVLSGLNRSMVLKF